MRTAFRLLLVLLLPVTAAHAQQTADAIIAKYAQRIGGLDRIRAIHTLRRTGKLYGGGGFEAPLTFESARPYKVREEATFGGMTGVTAYDGTTGWKIEPWQGKKDPEPLGEEETKGIVEDAEFDDPLLAWREEGNKVEYLGMDQVEGTDVYKLQVTLARNGDVRTYYLDADSGVPIKYEVKRTVRGAEREFEVELGDYKAVDGVFFPFSFAIGEKGGESSSKQQFAWQHIEVNVPLDDSRFTRPGATGVAAQPGDAKDASNRQPAPRRSAGRRLGSVSAALRHTRCVRGE